MSTEELISLARLCESYETELAFLEGLQETGLIEIQIVEEHPYVLREQVGDIEKMLRLHQELHINAEGIDIIFNLLQRIRGLQAELRTLRNY